MEEDPPKFPSTPEGGYAGGCLFAIASAIIIVGCLVKFFAHHS